jgi:NADPH2:quinone reductase
VKALVCSAFGGLDGLALGDLPEPAPKPGEIVIDVRAAGVNLPDLLVTQGLYQFRPDPPFAPGGEVAGTVRSVGEGVTAFLPGDRVAGFTLWGGFAERVAARADQCFKLPDGIEDIAAAGLVITYGTALHALKDRAVLRSAETLLVLGAAGGVGLAAVEIAAARGATVIAAASSDEKLDIARQHGAAHTINYGRDDLRAALKEATGGRGVDVVLDPVGGTLAEPALRSIAWEGRYLVVGFAAGGIPKLSLNLVLLKGCEVVGVFWSAFAWRSPDCNQRNLAEVLAMYASGSIRPRVAEVYPLERGVEAMRRLQERSVAGKLVIVPTQ